MFIIKWIFSSNSIRHNCLDWGCQWRWNWRECIYQIFSFKVQFFKQIIVIKYLINSSLLILLQVFIQIYGKLGKTEEVKLRNKTDNFEKAAKDQFKVSATRHIPLGYAKIPKPLYFQNYLLQKIVNNSLFLPKIQIEGFDVGRIQKVRIGHGNEGSMPGWFLDKVSF